MVSEFYERKRRLAITIALLSVGLLFAGLYLGFFIEVYSHPRAAADAEGACVIHRTRSTDDSGTQSRLLVLDGSLRLRGRTTLLGDARGLLADGDAVTAVFGARLAKLRDGRIVHDRDLRQEWEIEAAVRDARRGQSWIFGWSAGRIMARRIGGIGDSEAEAAAASPRVERLCAAIDGEIGPLLAWRESGATTVKAALYDGSRFVPCAEWEVGAAQFWDVVLLGRRAILLYHHRDDRSFSLLRIRARCCAKCGQPPPPAHIEFADPIFALGRRITGLAAAAAGDRLLLAVTRPTTVHLASVPIPSLKPEPGAKLAPLGAEPLWRRLVSWMFPLLMLFFSFSLIFLGFTLMKERGRFVLESLVAPAREGPVPAEILQRAMAFILDLMILLPVLPVLAHVVTAVPESSRLDLSDPRWRGLLGLAFGLDFAYHFAMEWAWGWTVGKRIIGVRVTEADGARLTFRGALVRNLVRPLDAQFPLGVFLGTSVLMITRRRQRLGDLLARTLVSQDRRPG